MEARGSKYRKKINDLSTETRDLLAMGASYWNGPAHVDARLAALMNFARGENPGEQLQLIADRLKADRPVSVLDLTRALFVTELGWVSNVMGPCDWENVNGGDQDATTLLALRTAQSELESRGVPASGTDPFGFHPLPF